MSYSFFFNENTLFLFITFALYNMNHLIIMSQNKYLPFRIPNKNTLSVFNTIRRRISTSTWKIKKQNTQNAYKLLQSNVPQVFCMQDRVRIKSL